MAGAPAGGGGGGHPADPLTRLRRRRGRWIGALVLFWVLVGALTGLLFWLGLRLEGRALPLVPVLWHQTLAALPWIVVSAAVGGLAWRLPLRRDTWRRVLPVHAAGVLATILAVNLTIPLLWKLGGSPFLPDGPYLREVLHGSLRWAHVVTVVYALLVLAVEGSRRHLVAAAPAAASPSAAESDAPRTPLVLQRGAGRLVVERGEIDWLEAQGDYVRVHVGEASHLVNHRLAELATELATAGFVRIHRSTVVNARRIRTMSPAGRGDRDVELRDGTVLRASRRRVAELLERLVELEGPTAQ